MCRQLSTVAAFLILLRIHRRAEVLKCTRLTQPARSSSGQYPSCLTRFDHGFHANHDSFAVLLLSKPLHTLSPASSTLQTCRALLRILPRITALDDSKVSAVWKMACAEPIAGFATFIETFTCRLIRCAPNVKEIVQQRRGMRKAFVRSGVRFVDWNGRGNRTREREFMTIVRARS